MIAALALVAEDVDFDAFVKAIGACNRDAVTTTIAAEDAQHSRFLLDAFKEQRAIALARADLAERRRRLHTREATSDTEAVLTLAGEALDERTRALFDARALDRSEQDMVAYFRTQYLRQCSAKGL